MRFRSLIPAGSLAAVVLTCSAVAASGATPSAHAGEAAAGGTVSIGELEPDHLMPQRSTSAFDQSHALFTPLMIIAPNGQLAKGSAQSLTSSHGGRVWTIKIKSGWKFSNGEPVTARSFVDAWNATAYGPNAWAANGQLANVQGYPALNPTAKGAKPKGKTLSGLRVLNRTTFRVALIKPDSQFPLELTAGNFAFYPLPAVAYKNLAAYDLAPIGNGPFVMDGKWRHNVAIKVKRRPDYEGPKPHVDAIDFKIYSDLHTAYNDVLAGNLDVTNIGNDVLAKAKQDFPGRLRTYNAPAIDNLDFPLYDARFKDIRIRHAISMAIDRKAISKALFAGILTPAADWVPASVLGARPGLCGVYCTYNPAKAKALLQAAGGWKGTMNIWYPGGIGYDPLFQAIGNQLRQNLGINVAYPTPAGFTAYGQALTDKKVDGPSRGHWGALYPSMANTLQALYTPTGGGYFETHYNNPKVTSLILQGNAAPTVPRSIHYYQLAEDQVKADFPTAPLFYAKYDYVFSKRVSNVIIDVNQIELGALRVK